MGHSLNKESFLQLVGNKGPQLEYYENYSDDEVSYTRYNLCQFEQDYENILLDYLEACGRKITSTNHNMWSDMFWVYTTKPTKSVDPSEFFDNWKPSYRFKTFHGLVAANVILILLLIVFGLYHNGMPT